MVAHSRAWLLLSSGYALFKRLFYSYYSQRIGHWQKNHCLSTLFLLLFSIILLFSSHRSVLYAPLGVTSLCVCVCVCLLCVCFFCKPFCMRAVKWPTYHCFIKSSFFSPTIIFGFLSFFRHMSLSSSVVLSSLHVVISIHLSLMLMWDLVFLEHTQTWGPLQDWGGFMTTLHTHVAS